MSALTSTVTPPAQAEPGWAPVAWQGLSFWAPADWTLIPCTDPREVRIQVVSPGTYTVQVRAQKPKRQVDLHAILDAYLKQIERQAKKKRIPFTGRVEEVGDRRLEYTWSAESKTHGIVYQCAQCMQAVIAEVSGAKDQPVLSMSRRIFSTLRDHSEDGWRMWSAFGLLTASPEKYALDASKFMSGHISMRFSRRGEMIVAERVGLANLALEKFAIEEWANVFGKWNNVRGSVAHATIHGHPGLQCRGRLRVFAGVKELGSLLLKGRLPALNVTGAAWHCPESNRLHLCNWFHRRPVELNDLLARTVCHLENADTV